MKTTRKASLAAAALVIAAVLPAGMLHAQDHDKGSGMSQQNMGSGHRQMMGSDSGMGSDNDHMSANGNGHMMDGSGTDHQMMGSGHHGMMGSDGHHGMIGN